MNRTKIYSYYTLTPIDIIECREWARENFDYYDGETSPLWNEHVQQEFARLNKERDAWRDGWRKTCEAIAADLRLIEEVEADFLDDADFNVINS